MNAFIRFCLENKLVVLLFAAGIAFWGILVAPFDWNLQSLPRDPVAVDAIPDIGENQQIVFTNWAGRSPQDIEDQITYPLTTALLGLPQVKTIRSYSMFGFSSIYVIFKEEAEFYWTRSRILEKLNSLPAGTLPENATPQLGPDATALGQVFWYTLEGHAPDGTPAGGWDLDELRSTQDWYVRYALQGVEGVAEVASIGGYVKEYQVDVDPDALRAFDIALHDVFDAVRSSNIDVGARTIEINSVEYVIRGLGLIQSLDDLRRTVITQRANVPITLDQVAEIEFGPALRRGALDKAGAEAVGGVVVTRYGENPLEVIKRVKAKIAEISPGLPTKTLENGVESQVRIIPFYDRTGLIYETLGTLENAVRQQILITTIVIVLMLFHLRNAFIVSSALPLAVLFAFIAMKIFEVDANVVALSGIAIAIGTIVDMGIVLTENILKHLERAKDSENRLEVVYRACTEVAGPVVTAALTTIISFLPVFAMEAAEGKLFRPLAFTKTFALIGAVAVALTIIPPLAHWLIARRSQTYRSRSLLWGIVALASIIAPFAIAWFPFWLAFAAIVIAVYNLFKARIPPSAQGWVALGFNISVAIALAIILSQDWQPMGVERGSANFIFAILSIGGVLGFAFLYTKLYPLALKYVLEWKVPATIAGFAIALFGGSVWLGFGSVFAWAPQSLKETGAWSAAARALPGLGKEFMPSLNEGSFLLMPSTMPHASIGETMDVMRKQDMAINAIPEVETVVGKLGRIESPLDPAPVSMIETMVSYKAEFAANENGDIVRQWRDHIRSPDDIWDEIVAAAAIPGVTSAPKLQPIETRLIMLQSGIRAPMAYKVQGPDLESIESVSLELESQLKRVPSIAPETVFADRVIGKPYLEIDIDRESIARYGIKISSIQDVIEVAIGGAPITQTVEGRERYPVRVRYQREFRDSIEEIEKILVAAPDGTQIPLKELASINYARGPQVIKSENTFLTSYVIFDMRPGYSEVEVVEQANAHLKEQLDAGNWTLPAGVPMPQAIGSYENQVRSEKKLKVVLPLALFAIWLVLYLQFKRISMTLLVFSGILFAWAGGFILIWLYAQTWFFDFEILGSNLRELFQMGPINLSVAVWVGFLALFGIATDDGVLMSTYLEQRFRDESPTSKSEVRQYVIDAASRRIRPAMITSATTLLALLPVLTSTGRGSDIMVPMAIPIFGGMLLAILTTFVVPVLYCSLKELKLAQAR